LPALGGNTSLAAGESGEDFFQSAHAPRGELDGVFNAVEHPTQYSLAGVPGAIAGEKFLDRDGLLARAGIVGAEGPENGVNRLKKDAPDSVLSAWPPLY
jgi:hypothetical protein